MALVRVIRDRVTKLTIVVRTGDKSWFDNRSVLTHDAKHRVYRVWSHSMTQADWEKYMVARRCAQLVYEDAERAFTKVSSTEPNSQKSRLP